MEHVPRNTKGSASSFAVATKSQRGTGVMPRSTEIQVVPYDPAWEGEYRQILGRLSRILPGARIQHVGSTAVPGCAAKPIIDVSVGLGMGESLHADDARAAGLEFRSVRSYSVVFAISNPDRSRRAHVHVRARGSDPELSDLLFRDYLRTHPQAVVDYSRLKHRLAATKRTGSDYTRSKAPYIERTIERARRWAKKAGWSPPS